MFTPSLAYSNFMNSVSARFKPKSDPKKQAWPPVEFLAVLGVIIALIPLEVLQLDYLLFGFFCLCCVDAWLTRYRSVTAKAKKGAGSLTQNFKAGPSALLKSGQAVQLDEAALNAADVASIADSDSTSVRALGARRRRLPKPVGKVDRCSFTSAAPVLQTGMGWSADVTEFLKNAAPSSQTHELREKLSVQVQHALSALIPNCEFATYASSNFLQGSVYGNEVPEVDIVINVSEEALIRDSGCGNVGFLLKKRHQGLLDATKLYKSVLRNITEELGTQGFKFIGSMFRSFEPHIQVMAPLEIEPGTLTWVPFVLGINTTVPYFLSSLSTTCSKFAPSAAGLLLLVRRWARERSLSFAARGYFPPLHWNLLVVYFLQVREEGPLLPLLRVTKTSAGYAASATAEVTREWCGTPKHIPSTGALFKEFVRFYNSMFDWERETVSIRIGDRQQSMDKLKSRVILDTDSAQTNVVPAFEDPFNANQNLLTPMTWTSLSRTREELARADTLASSGALLAELLEPWREPQKQEDLRDAVRAPEAPVP